MKKIAIIGAGLMGTDIAIDLACHGHKVILKDISEKVINNSKDKINKDFKLIKMMKSELKHVSKSQIISNIKFSLTYEDFDDVDLIIENITENIEAKQSLYKELKKVCKGNPIYAVNTSCVSITKIASLLTNPDKVIGVHFMNPVPLKKLTEVIKGYHTSDSTVELMSTFLKSLNKVPVVVNDFPGFVTNRVLMLTINECIWLVQDSVADPKNIDKIFRLGFGHQMGPLATADLIGLDTILDSLNVLYESYKDSKFRACPLLNKMVDAGLLGKKSGKGFFTYDA